MFRVFVLLQLLLICFLVASTFDAELNFDVAGIGLNMSHVGCMLELPLSVYVTDATFGVFDILRVI